MGKILILANNGIGLYKFRKELIEELLIDNEVYISLPYGDFIEELVHLGCDFIETHISRRGTNPLTDMKLILHYKKILNRIKPDIVLTYTIKPNIYGGLICRLMKIPYINNITGLGTAVAKKGFFQHLLLKLYQIALKSSSCVFLQNKENAEYMVGKGIIKGKYLIIPGSGVNFDQYGLLPYPEDKNVNFLFISRIMKSKGIDQYLDAARYIKTKYSETQFFILGFCEETYEEILKNMDNEGLIQYFGFQKNTRCFHLTSHCTIHPTYYPEGMSNVLLESAAYGRPIITTNRSGCKEIVDDGVNGFIVEERNSQDLIEKIERFLKLSYEGKKQMGLAGREKVYKQFDRRVIIEAYKDQINIVLRGKENEL